MKQTKRNIIIGVLVVVFLFYGVMQVGKIFFSPPGHSGTKGDSEVMAPKGTVSKQDVVTNPTLAQQLSADAAIVMDQNTGRVLFAKNADRMEYPASMTKMMTCILAIESGKLDSIITVSNNASAVSDTYLVRGDRIRLSDLLYLLMLSSNNGSAVAVAEFIAKTTPNFINLMNRKAKMIGMTHTHFVTPNGMHDVNHYSTARDMAILARYCMHNSLFREIVATQQKRVTYKFPAGKNIHCRNENKMLDLYDGVNGVKTGFTDTALCCLATSYEKNGLRLITIVMHSRKGQLKFYDTMKMLDWTKATYRR
jgi:D-alanyl-D-alanine carboxypeptidase (penicillin-binding protein 5/6)